MKQLIREYILISSMFTFAATQLYLFYKSPIAAAIEIITAGITIYCLNQELEETGWR